MPRNTSTIPNLIDAESLIVAYYSLILMVVGTLLNLLTFIVLCQRTFRDTAAKPTLHFVRTIALFDILMLYGWNLDHYLTTMHNFHILSYSIASCKWITFISYFTPQASAWLRVFVCLDRYLSLSNLHRTWFNHSKSVLIIIVSIAMTSALLNLHLLLFACYRRANGKISVDASFYHIYPMWDYVHLVVYNCLPFIAMTILNCAVIHRLIRLRQTSVISRSQSQHWAITVTLVITSSLFLLMTIPSTVAFAFFPLANRTLLRFLDGILYTYHITSFPIYFFTFGDFRRECLKMFHFTCCPQKSSSQVNIQPVLWRWRLMILRSIKQNMSFSWIYFFSVYQT